MADSSYQPTIIAEAGVNHNGKLDMALKLVDCALAAQADVVKFQVFNAKLLVSERAEKACYQKENSGATETQFAMLEKLALSESEFKIISKYCSESGIEFLATAFDKQSLEFLVNELGLRKLKIPSGDLNNGPLLLDHSRQGLDLIVSTGMATLGEIEESLGVIAFGLLNSGEPPSRRAFVESYRSAEGQKLLKSKVTLLHCTTEYPTPAEEVNLLAIETLHNAFKLNVGFSDHSVGNIASVVATTFGATILEKHFTTDRLLEGPDHKASLDPEQLCDYTYAVREVGSMLGSGLKVATKSEVRNIKAARRSLIAARDIKEGELFDEDSIVVKRPANGTSPMSFWDYIGTASSRDYSSGDFI